MRTPIKFIYLRRMIALFILVCFFITNINIPFVRAQEFSLPAPGQMVALSPAYSPIVLKGIKLDPQNPFRFHFFVDTGDEYRHPERSEGSQGALKEESAKLIKYFLASLAIPEKDLWVNLSPYEKDRIVPQEFGQTEMGRDLLAQDYLLKQITASLIYPESQLGKEFWAKVYAQAQAKYGTTNIPVNTFNKVWIVPEKAVVYENGGTAFVLENHLKVMLEQDYLSMSKHADGGVAERGASSASAGFGEHAGETRGQAPDINLLGSQIIREIVIPALTKEVNEGKNFSQLRQVFYSLILATWYKKKIKDSILNKVYSDRKKTQGLVIPAKAGIHNKNDVEAIYQQYLQAFKKGVYNYIKEEPDPLTNQTIPRKYFSGGVEAYQLNIQYKNPAQVSNKDFVQRGTLFEVNGDVAMVSRQFDSAVNTEKPTPVGSIEFSREDLPILTELSKTEGLKRVWQRLEDVLVPLDHKMASILLDKNKLDSASHKMLVVKKGGQRKLVVSLLESIFQHAIENATDAIIQGVETGKVSNNQSLKIDFYVYEEDGHVVINMVNNGISVREAESTEQKIAKKLSGKQRIGGKGKGLLSMRSYAQKIHPDAEVNLMERMDVLKDEAGAVLQIRFPKMNPNEIELGDVIIQNFRGMQRFALPKLPRWTPIQELDNKILVNESGQIRFNGAEPLVPISEDDFGFYWVRHGQTYSNTGVLRPEIRNQLTEEGKLQSQRAARILWAALKSDIQSNADLVVITSPKERTQETAQYFLKLVENETGVQIKPEVESFLDEMSLGLLDENGLGEISRAGKNVREFLDRFNRGMDAIITPPGTSNMNSPESYLNLVIRTKKRLENFKARMEARKQSNGGRKVIVAAFVHSIQTSALMVNLGVQSMEDPKEGIINWRRNRLANADPVFFDPHKREVVKVDRAMNTDATQVVYPKNTMSQRNKDVIDFITSAYFQRKVGLNLAQGEHKLLNIGPGAFPYDMTEWYEALKKFGNQKLALTTTELPTAHAKAYLHLKDFLTKENREHIVDNLRRMFNPKCTPEELNDFILVVDGNYHITEALVGGEISGHQYYATIAVSPEVKLHTGSVDRINLDDTYTNNILFQKTVDYLKTRVNLTGPDDLMKLIESKTSPSGISIQIDPIESELRKIDPNMRYVLTDNPARSGVVNQSVIMVNNLLGDLSKENAQEFINTMKDSLAEEGVLVIKTLNALEKVRVIVVYQRLGENIKEIGRLKWFTDRPMLEGTGVFQDASFNRTELLQEWIFTTVMSYQKAGNWDEINAKVNFILRSVVDIANNPFISDEEAVQLADDFMNRNFGGREEKTSASSPNPAMQTSRDEAMLISQERVKQIESKVKEFHLQKRLLAIEEVAELEKDPVDDLNLSLIQDIFNEAMPGNATRRTFYQVLSVVKNNIQPGSALDHLTEKKLWGNGTQWANTILPQILTNLKRDYPDAVSEHFDPIFLQKKGDSIEIDNVYLEKRSNSIVISRIGPIVYYRKDLLPYLSDIQELNKDIIFIPMKNVPGKQWYWQSTFTAIAAIYDMRDQIKGKVFIDYGAGDGALGLLASELGAQKVVFLESDSNSVKGLKGNVQTCKAPYQIIRSPEDLSNKDIQGAVVAINTGPDFGQDDLKKYIFGFKPEVVISAGATWEDSQYFRSYLKRKNLPYDYVLMQDDEEKKLQHVAFIARRGPHNEAMTAQSPEPANEAMNAVPDSGAIQNAEQAFRNKILESARYVYRAVFHPESADLSGEVDHAGFMCSYFSDKLQKRIREVHGLEAQIYGIYGHALVGVTYQGELWLADPTWRQFVPENKRSGLPQLLLVKLGKGVERAADIVAEELQRLGAPIEGGVPSYIEGFKELQPVPWDSAMRSDVKNSDIDGALKAWAQKKSGQSTGFVVEKGDIIEGTRVLSVVLKDGDNNQLFVQMSPETMDGINEARYDFFVKESMDDQEQGTYDGTFELVFRKDGSVDGPATFKTISPQIKFGRPFWVVPLVEAWCRALDGKAFDVNHPVLKGVPLDIRTGPLWAVSQEEPVTGTSLPGLGAGINGGPRVKAVIMDAMGLFQDRASLFFKRFEAGGFEISILPETDRRLSLRDGKRIWLSKKLFSARKGPFPDVEKTHVSSRVFLVLLKYMISDLLASQWRRSYGEPREDLIDAMADTFLEAWLSQPDEFYSNLQSSLDDVAVLGNVRDLSESFGEIDRQFIGNRIDFSARRRAVTLTKAELVKAVGCYKGLVRDIFNDGFSDYLSSFSKRTVPRDAARIQARVIRDISGLIFAEPVSVDVYSLFEIAISRAKGGLKKQLQILRDGLELFLNLSYMRRNYIKGLTSMSPKMDREYFFGNKPIREDISAFLKLFLRSLPYRGVHIVFSGSVARGNMIFGSDHDLYFVVDDDVVLSDEDRSILLDILENVKLFLHSEAVPEGQSSFDLESNLDLSAGFITRTKFRENILSGKIGLLADEVKEKGVLDSWILSEDPKFVDEARGVAATFFEKKRDGIYAKVISRLKEAARTADLDEEITDFKHSPLALMTLNDIVFALRMRGEDLRPYDKDFDVFDFFESLEGTLSSSVIGQMVHAYALWGLLRFRLLEMEEKKKISLEQNAPEVWASLAEKLKYGSAEELRTDVSRTRAWMRDFILSLPNKRRTRLPSYVDRAMNANNLPSGIEDPRDPILREIDRIKQIIRQRQAPFKIYGWMVSPEKALEILGFFETQLRFDEDWNLAKVTAIGEDLDKFKRMYNITDGATNVFSDDRIGLAKESLLKMGIKTGDRVINIGDKDPILGLAALEMGVHYISFDPNMAKYETQNIFAQALAESQHQTIKLEARNGLFQEGSDASKDIPERSQDTVLILTGVLSDPNPESSAIATLKEALRVVKNKGKFIVGSYFTSHFLAQHEFESQKTRDFINIFGKVHPIGQQVTLRALHVPPYDHYDGFIKVIDEFEITFKKPANEAMNVNPTREQMELYAEFKKQTNETFIYELRASVTLTGYLSSYAGIFGIPPENLRTRLNNLFKTRGYLDLIDFIKSNGIQLPDLDPVPQRQRLQVPVTIAHEGGTIELMIYTKGDYIDRTIFDNEELRQKIVNKIQSIFKLNTVQILQNYSLGNRNGLLRINFGDHDLFLKFFKDDNVLAIFGYATQQKIHGGETFAFKQAFKDYLRIFQFTTYDNVRFKAVTLLDRAMIIDKHNTGGIDFNPAQMTMQVKKEGEDFKFNFNGVEIDATQVTGATFTIRTMTPVTNLPQILGLTQEPADKSLT